MRAFSREDENLKLPSRSARRALAQFTRRVGWTRTRPHFVQSYDRLVRSLLAKYPLDQAMEIAVGGDYDRIGGVERAILQYAGLSDGMTLLDFGCGTGRLARALGESLSIDYFGVDIIQRFLDYAKTKSPSSYRYLLNRTFELPLSTASVDMVAAFSVFTHLNHAETYLYLKEIHRVLRVDGCLVLSFLEFGEPAHWQVFADTVAEERIGTLVHLNQFIERSTIDVWCEKIGFRRERFVDALEAPWLDAPALGQAVAILRRASSGALELQSSVRS